MLRQVSWLVHGEIDTLRSLLGHLGYSSDGKHPQGRRLVFVGDLTDRGPDSPAVVDFVASLIESGRAQCVLGNHDLNILLDHRKPENKWFWGEEYPKGDEEDMMAEYGINDVACDDLPRGVLIGTVDLLTSCGSNGNALAHSH